MRGFKIKQYEYVVGDYIVINDYLQFGYINIVVNFTYTLFNPFFMYIVYN